MQRTYKYEEMLPEEFQEAVRRMPVFFFPTGLLEWHGDHLPLGQDTLKSYGICLETARKLGGGIVLPPHYWGRPGFSSYVGTLTFTEETLRPLFLEVFKQIEKVGGRVLLVLTGHYGTCQVEFVKAVAAEHNASGSPLTVIAQPEYEGVEIDGQRPADHAGKWETSMFWHMYPRLTHMENFKPGKITIPHYESPPDFYYREKPDWEWREDLRKVASPQLGKRAVDVISDHLKDVILESLRKVS
jgi:creatinine amidohydrolase